MPYKLTEGDCSYCNLCLNCEVAERAEYGAEAVFAYRQGKGKEFGEIQSGSKIYKEGVPRYKTLDDIQIVNNLLSENRERKREDLGREPLYIDVNTETKIGGFKVKTPMVIAAMGSTDVANWRGMHLGKGAAQAGIVYVIGENVFNMRGYDKRIDPNQPTLKERILSFLENAGDYGGVVIQQNVEDAAAGVWDTVFNDKDLQKYFERKLIGFEAKGGQGAKPGMGGEVQVNKNLAMMLADKYYFPDDPRKVEKEKYQRHSVPGTMTEDSLEELILTTKEKYKGVPIWFKTGPYLDIAKQIEIAQKNGVNAITIDGAEGGTGMSPICTMDNIGLPTLKCLEILSKNKGNSSMIIAGGIKYGGQIVKSLALGADAVAMGRAFIIAAETGIKKLDRDGALGIKNFVEADTIEVKQLISSLPKYEIKELESDDVQALDHDVAKMFVIRYIYEPSTTKFARRKLQV